MLLSLWPNYWEDWEGQWAFTFDGENRTITVNSAFYDVDVKRMYSEWKQWVAIRDHAKFIPALRVIGGDPVGSGMFAGDIYFLTNQWQVVVPHNVRFNGVLYHDDPMEPFVVLPGGGVISTVSNLVQTAETAYNVWSQPPTATEIAAQISPEFNQVNTTLSELRTLIESGEVDLTDVLMELAKVGRKVDDTQAMVLSK